MKRSNHTLEALKNLKQIGSLSSSSRYLAKTMMKRVDFSKDLKIVELGAGNGAITRKILNEMNENSTLTSYEICDTFLQDLEGIDDKRLTVLNQNVSELSTLDFDSVDVVISSLPLALFDKEFKSEIYNNVQQIIKKKGMFIQFQYSLFDYRDIEKFFNNCNLDFCLLNFPPAFVYNIELD